MNVWVIMMDGCRSPAWVCDNLDLAQEIIKRVEQDDQEAWLYEIEVHSTMKQAERYFV